MTGMTWGAWICLLSPLAAAILILLGGTRISRRAAAWISTTSVFVAFGGAVWAFVGVHAQHVSQNLLCVDFGAECQTPGHLTTAWTWLSSGRLHIPLQLLVDPLSTMMMLIVSGVGGLIVMYSIGYMEGDPEERRYFAYIAFFVFSMLMLVEGGNLLMLLVGWGLVGLSSYLLIGFWHERPSAVAAAKKAFVMNAFGDATMALALFIVIAHTHSLSFDKLGASYSSSTANWIALGLLGGAVAKSAQIPLQTWLPDAMEGPTPVSALIHAATMVTAGVYLVARCMPLFGQSPTALLVVACIGAFTALLAALIAITQTDLKRVMAYSTVSQLGYMFLALGSGVPSRHLATFAVSAAMFHLFTHAFFKALLFLASGSVMHAMGDVIDMRRFSGLRTVLPTTHWTFACGAAALAGVPVVGSGFWSKDEILADCFDAHHGLDYGGVYLVVFVVGVVTAGITGFYTARAYFLTFWGEVRIPPEAYSHGHSAAALVNADGHGHAPQADTAPSHAAHGGGPHESPPVMTVPLMILAVGAVSVGAILGVGPWHLFEHFLDAHYLSGFPRPILPEHEGQAPFSWTVMLLSSVFALGGIGIAYAMYVAQPGLADRLSRSMAVAYDWSRNKFYLDELYEAFFVGPVTALAHVLRVFDQYILDGLVDLVGHLPSFVGYLLRPAQNGLVQFYALLTAIGVAGFVTVALLRW
jgi:NADH-quinone oxidoreductase subunit L